MFAQCMADQGRGAACPACPLARDEVCAEVLRCLRELAAGLRGRDFRLAGADRENLIEETLEDVIMRAAGEPVLNAAALTAGIFRRKRANLFAALPRFGEWTERPLPFVPEGLAALAARRADALRLAGERLALAAEPDAALRAELLELSAEPRWRGAIERLCAHARRPRAVDGETAEGASLFETLAAPSRTEPEARLLAQEQRRVALEPYLRAWRALGTEQAARCIELFSGDPRIADSEPGERAELAAELGLSENALNQRIGRCHALIHQYLAARLTDGAEEEEGEGALTGRLAARIYGPGLTGWRERLERAAREEGISTGRVARLLRRCLDRLAEGES